MKLCPTRIRVKHMKETKKRWEQGIIGGILFLALVLVIIYRVAIWDILYTVYCSVAISLGW